MATVFCKKAQKEGKALAFAPFPGELGKRILEEICEESWKDWLNYQVMLINEHRLNMADLQAREYLKRQMIQYFFEDEDAVDKPQGYTPPLEEK